MTPLTSEILKRIDALAEKLGVASGQLWSVIVAQARVEGITLLIIAGVLAIVAVGLARLVKRFWGTDDDAESVIVVVGSVGCVVASTIAFGCAIGSITPLLNPQYWALQEIVKQLGAAR